MDSRVTTLENTNRFNLVFTEDFIDRTATSISGAQLIISQANAALMYSGSYDMIRLVLTVLAVSASTTKDVIQRINMEDIVCSMNANNLSPYQNRVVFDSLFSRIIDYNIPYSNDGRISYRQISGGCSGSSLLASNGSWKFINVKPSAITFKADESGVYNIHLKVGTAGTTFTTSIRVKMYGMHFNYVEN